MILGAVSALAAAVFGMFLLSLVLLLFAVVFFAVFFASGRKKTDGFYQAFKDDEYFETHFSKEDPEPIQEYKLKIPSREEEKFMLYCRSCGFIGSRHFTENELPCPKCGTPLLMTTTTYDRFHALSNDRKASIVKSWASL